MDWQTTDTVMAVILGIFWTAWFLFVFSVKRQSSAARTAATESEKGH